MNLLPSPSQRRNGLLFSIGLCLRVWLGRSLVAHHTSKSHLFWKDTIKLKSSSLLLSTVSTSTESEESKDTLSSSRRALMLGVPSAMALVLGGRLMESQTYFGASAGVVSNVLTLDEAVDMIDNQCNRVFFHAVVASGYRFLYRGVPKSPFYFGTTKPSWRTEPSDLLSGSAYGPSSVPYFQSLADTAVELGHLATTSPEDAAPWGEPVSVWPLGDAVTFAWYKDGGNFWPRDIQSSSTTALDGLIVNGLRCGEEGLMDALDTDHTEIMFSSYSSEGLSPVPPFLTIPLSMESELRERLQSSFLI